MRYQLFLGAAAVALIVPAAASAQETTSIIRGTVTNNGAPVADASVVATDVASGTRVQTTTNGDGGFTLVGLRPGGPYTVDVKSDQGSTSVSDLFTVVQQTFELPIELVKDSSADIVVTASSIRGAGNVSRGVRRIIRRRAAGRAWVRC